MPEKIHEAPAAEKVHKPAPPQVEQQGPEPLDPAAAAVLRGARAEGARPPLPPAQVLRLQRTAGNRAVSRALPAPVRPLRRGLAIQPRLTVGAAHDPYEAEADRVAEQVLAQVELPGQSRAIAPSSGDGAGAAGPSPGLQREGEDEEEVQTKRIQRAGDEEEEEVQTRRVDPMGSFETSAGWQQRLEASSSGGVPLPGDVRSYMEPRFGADFSGVRVHAGSESASLNREISAQAFTHRQDIYLGEGKFEPGTTGGKRLLAHELAHVVQQGAAGGPGRVHMRLNRKNRIQAKLKGTYGALTEVGTKGRTWNQIRTRARDYEAVEGKQVTAITALKNSIDGQGPKWGQEHRFREILHSGEFGGRFAQMKTILLDVKARINGFLTLPKHLRRAQTFETKEQVIEQSKKTKAGNIRDTSELPAIEEEAETAKTKLSSSTEGYTVGRISALKMLLPRINTEMGDIDSGRFAETALSGDLTVVKYNAVGGAMNKLDEVKVGNLTGYFAEDKPQQEGGAAPADLGQIKGRDPRLAARSVAMSRLDRLFQTDVLVRTEFAVSGRVEVGSQGTTPKQRMGIFMEKAQGKEAGKVTSSGEDVSFDDPVLQSSLNKLQMLDVICGQLDRHVANYYVQVQNGKVASIKGIDNDMSFGVGLSTVELPPGTTGVHYRGMPPLIDADLGRRILQVTDDEVRAVLEGLLSPQELQNTIARLGLIRTQVLDMQTKGLFVSAPGAVRPQARGGQGGKDLLGKQRGTGTPAWGSTAVTATLRGGKESYFKVFVDVSEMGQFTHALVQAGFPANMRPAAQYNYDNYFLGAIDEIIVPPDVQAQGQAAAQDYQIKHYKKAHPDTPSSVDGYLNVLVQSAAQLVWDTVAAGTLTKEEGMTLAQQIGGSMPVPKPLGAFAIKLGEFKDAQVQLLLNRRNKPLPALPTQTNMPVPPPKPDFLQPKPPPTPVPPPKPAFLAKTPPVPPPKPQSMKPTPVPPPKPEFLTRPRPVPPPKPPSLFAPETTATVEPAPPQQEAPPQTWSGGKKPGLVSGTVPIPIVLSEPSQTCDLNNVTSVDKLIRHILGLGREDLFHELLDQIEAHGPPDKKAELKRLAMRDFHADLARTQHEGIGARFRLGKHSLAIRFKTYEELAGDTSQYHRAPASIPVHPGSAHAFRRAQPGQAFTGIVAGVVPDEAEGQQPGPFKPEIFLSPVNPQSYSPTRSFAKDFETGLYESVIVGAVQHSGGQGLTGTSHARLRMLVQQQQQKQKGMKWTANLEEAEEEYIAPSKGSAVGFTVVKVRPGAHRFNFTSSSMNAMAFPFSEEAKQARGTPERSKEFGIEMKQPPRDWVAAVSASVNAIPGTAPGPTEPGAPVKPTAPPPQPKAPEPKVEETGPSAAVGGFKVSDTYELVQGDIDMLVMMLEESQASMIPDVVDKTQFNTASNPRAKLRELIALLMQASPTLKSRGPKSLEATLGRLLL